MVDTLAAEALYNAVQARFLAEGTAAANVFGWRKPAQYPIGDRVAWVPGDPSGNIGETGPARNPGRNPRPIGTLRELFTVVINAADPTDPENELAQYKAARLLRDAWYRAVYLAAHGTFAIKSESWITSTLERRYGAALRVVCWVEAMIPDSPLASAPVDTAALISLSLQTGPSEDDTIEGGGGGSTTEPSGGVAYVDTQSNKRMAAFATVADGDAACGVAVAKTPAPNTYVGVRINGIDIPEVGNGTRSNAAVYFSGDGGTTARAWSAIQLGDTCHWQGSIAGYQLATTDIVEFVYEEI
jgi:hypothetical protein